MKLRLSLLLAMVACAGCSLLVDPNKNKLGAEDVLDPLDGSTSEKDGAMQDGGSVDASGDADATLDAQPDSNRMCNSAVQCNDNDPCSQDNCESSLCTYEPADVDSDDYSASQAQGQTCSGGTDCNDSDPTVHPGAVEICDGVDNDCSMGVDNACEPDTCVHASAVTLSEPDGSGLRYAEITGNYTYLTGQYTTDCEGNTGLADAVYSVEMEAGFLYIELESSGSGNRRGSVAVSESCEPPVWACDTNDPDVYLYYSDVPITVSILVKALNPGVSTYTVNLIWASI